MNIGVWRIGLVGQVLYFGRSVWRHFCENLCIIDGGLRCLSKARIDKTWNRTCWFRGRLWYIKREDEGRAGLPTGAIGELGCLKNHLGLLVFTSTVGKRLLTISGIGAGNSRHARDWWGRLWSIAWGTMTIWNSWVSHRSDGHRRSHCQFLFELAAGMYWLLQFHLNEWLAVPSGVKFEEGLMEELKCWTAVWILLPAVDKNAVTMVTERITILVNLWWTDW